MVAPLAFAAVACNSGDDRSAVLEAVEIVQQDEWGQIFGDETVAGTFALREVGTGKTMVSDGDRVEQPRSPASTFKILNSMIILQTGVVADVDELVPWGGVVRELEAWNRDHSLGSGIEVSSVWMYQGLARFVGEERMAEWVTAAGYGNADISGGIDEFWLSGDLRISPLGQLDRRHPGFLADRPAPTHEGATCSAVS